MSRASKLLGGSAMPVPNAKNEEDYPAFVRPLEEQYLQCLMTNTLGSTFYASQKDIIAGAAKLHHDMLSGVDIKGPASLLPSEALGDRLVLAAQMIVYARNEGFMRTQPIYGLAKLSAAGAVGRALFESIFPLVIRTPNDLMDFASIVQGMGRGQGGRCIKRVAGEWLVSRLTEYWAIKYGAKKEGGYSLRDLFRAYHPKMAKTKSNTKQRDLVDYILRDEWRLLLQPQITAFETLKGIGVAGKAKDKIAYITKGRLPHEVASPFAGKDPAVWAAIAGQMPIFALLRHLATLERHGLLPSVVDHITKVFSDPKIVLKSKIFPYRFLDAMEKVSHGLVRDALRDAVEISMANIPDLPGRTVVMIDRSGSMASYVRMAAIFGIGLAKKSEDCRVFAFNTELEECHVSRRDSVLSQASQLQARGGTDTSLPVEYITQEQHFADNIILIGDEQQNAGTAFYKAIERYRKKVNRDVKVFMVNVAPYTGAALLPPERAFYLFGWSDRILQFISMAAKGFGSMAKAVSSIKITEEVRDGMEDESEE